MYADEEKAALRNRLLRRGMGMVTAGERRPRGGRSDGALIAASGAPGADGGGTKAGGGPGPPGSAEGRALEVAEGGREGGDVHRLPARPRGGAGHGRSACVCGDTRHRAGVRVRECVCALRRGDCSLKWVGRWPVPGMFHDV